MGSDGDSSSDVWSADVSASMLLPQISRGGGAGPVPRVVVVVEVAPGVVVVVGAGVVLEVVVGPPAIVVEVVDDAGVVVVDAPGVLVDVVVLTGAREVVVEVELGGAWWGGAGLVLV